MFVFLRHLTLRKFEKGTLHLFDSMYSYKSQNKNHKMLNVYRIQTKIVIKNETKIQKVFFFLLVEFFQSL